MWQDRSRLLASEEMKLEKDLLELDAGIICTWMEFWWVKYIFVILIILEFYNVISDDCWCTFCHSCGCIVIMGTRSDSMP